MDEIKAVGAGVRANCTERVWSADPDHAGWDGSRSATRCNSFGNARDPE